MCHNEQASGLQQQLLRSLPAATVLGAFDRLEAHNTRRAEGEGHDVVVEKVLSVDVRFDTLPVGKKHSVDERASYEGIV